MNDTTTRDLRAILADLADYTVASTGGKAITLYHELEDAVRAEFAPLPEGETDELAAQADRAARTMAPPAPDVTQNAGYTVRAVLPGHPAERGLLQSWWVAAERADDGEWVTWEAYALDHPGKIGTLAYNSGHYFNAVSGPSGLGRAASKRRALADLAVRAGLTREIALRIADEMTRPGHDTTAEDKRAARRLRTRFTR